MNAPEILVEVAPELAVFVPHARRTGTHPLAVDGVSTLGHVVESLGVPLTEVGALLVDGHEAPVSHIPSNGESVAVRPVARPQQVPGAPLRFLLDVHLGTLARRLRLLGVDTAYESTDIGDPALAARSAAEQRVMLSRDRGLLRRRELWAGAFVYSTRPEDQLRDILDRFRPDLRPWSRCTACNGLLHAATKDEVADQLEHGTHRSYDVFARCESCGRAYWKGAHHEQLEAIVEDALSMRAQGN
ncbi:Mut7-C RNAse domain-containing protein [Streptomyces sp. NPDC000345]|uniref:Mut7-C RNAse domain-containing protein n=1 Tax=Streptomyces sp. NPDC000345 TaxID=3364537 RepID=UPI0036B717F8